MLNKKRYPVHRVSYQFFKGTIPDKQVIMHTCDVTSCINPDHLKPATQKENIQDMITKGRDRKVTRDEIISHRAALREYMKNI